MSDDGMRSWRRAAVVALGVIVVSVPLYVARELHRDVAEGPAAETVAGFVGRDKCIDCHQGAYELWVGSDHDNAMDIANEQTIRGAEARLGEDHHARGALQKMRAGARSDNQEERVLHLAVQPDDSRQPAEHLVLATFLEDGGIAAPFGHAGTSAWACSRAWRSCSIRSGVRK